jgi:hypothetical protein
MILKLKTSKTTKILKSIKYFAHIMWIVEVSNTKISYIHLRRDVAQQKRPPQNIFPLKKTSLSANISRFACVYPL